MHGHCKHSYLSQDKQWNRNILIVMLQVVWTSLHQVFLEHKAKDINQVSALKVDIWKQAHDDKNIFNETFEGEHTGKK